MEAIRSNSKTSIWAAVLLAEMALGICSFILPLEQVLLLLLIPPIMAFFFLRSFYAYLLGVLLLPFWAITITGQMDTPGQVDVRMSDVVFLMAGVAWLFQGFKERHLQINGSPLDVPIVLLFLWILVSLTWAPNLDSAVKEVLRKLNGLFIFYLTINFVRTRKDLNTALVIWIAAGILAAVLGFYELITEIAQRLGRLGNTTAMRWGGFRAGGLTVTPNVLGFFLNTALMVTIARFQVAEKVKHRAVLMFVVVLMVLTVVTTLSRMSIVGLILGSSALILLQRKGTKNFGLVVAGVLGLVVILLLLGGPVYRTVLAERYSAIFNPEEAGGFGKRLYIWFEVAGQMFADNPVAGTGVGGVVTLASKYGAWKLKSPHNLYIYILSEFGLVGFLFFLTVVFSFIKTVLDAFRRIVDDKDKCILTGLVICIFLYGFQGLTINFILREPELWVLLGLTLSAVRIFPESGTATPPEVNKARYGS